MASKSPPKSPPVRGRAPGALEGVPNKRWRQLERVAQALRSLGDTPIVKSSKAATSDFLLSTSTAAPQVRPA